MNYKVTAFHDVTILAYVRDEGSERQEWISLEAGEVRNGLGLVIGIHPNSLPNETPTHVEGVSMILPAESWSNENLPKGFFGFYRL